MAEAAAVVKRLVVAIYSAWVTAMLQAAASTPASPAEKKLLSATLTMQLMVMVAAAALSTVLAAKGLTLQHELVSASACVALMVGGSKGERSQCQAPPPPRRRERSCAYNFCAFGRDFPLTFTRITAI